MSATDRFVIRDRVRALEEPMIRFRRDLHAHPELGFQEDRTARKVAEGLDGVLTDIRTGIAKTGVTGLLKPKGGVNRAILLRADMDALPIQEETNAAYASKNPNVMHACGHDGHTSILLHTAKAAAAESLKTAGAVRFVFQPAEEGPGGALPMITQGILNDPPVEAAFGLHLWTSAPSGKVAVTAGPTMAAADEFAIIVHGKGGHGALPHQTVDAVSIGSQLVTALQTLVARNTDPMQTAVVSIGSFHAGDNFNIIAEKAEMKGTLRTFDAEVREMLIRRLGEMIEGICAANGARGEFVFKDHYPATINDPAMADFVAECAAAVVGEENVIRDFSLMGGEDMSYFLQKVPGVFFFLGAGNEEKGTTYPHHSPHFDFDEDVMAIGAEIFLQIIERYWERFDQPPKHSS